MNIGCVYSVDDYVSAAKPLPSFSAVPFGIASIATVLERAGYGVEMLVFTPETKVRGLLGEYIKKNRPRLFCLTAVTSQYHLISEVARAIKEIDPSIKIILGGHHATLNPGETIEESYFDAICIGEGERAVVEYARLIERGEEPARIANLWIKNEKSGFVEKTPPEPFIEDLDNFPHIDREMWEGWVADPETAPAILLGRGCPNRCTYCSNHALARIAPGRYVRFRPREDVISELEEIAERYPRLKSVYLEVETVSTSLEYAYALCGLLEKFNLKRGKPVTFGVNLVVTKNIVKNCDEFLGRLRKANFKYLNIGLESGSEKIRNEVLRRPEYSNNGLADFCRRAKECGIDVYLFVLMGIPGETRAEFEETIDCVRRCDPAHVYLSIFYPYPGTDLYLKAKEMKLFAGGIVDPLTERRRAVLDLPGFSRRRIRREYLLFPYRAFKGKKPLYRIIPLMLVYYFTMRPRLNSLYRRLVGHKILAGLKSRISTFSE